MHTMYTSRSLHVTIFSQTHIVGKWVVEAGSRHVMSHSRHITSRHSLSVGNGAKRLSQLGDDGGDAVGTPEGELVGVCVGEGARRGDAAPRKQHRKHRLAHFDRRSAPRAGARPTAEGDPCKRIVGLFETFGVKLKRVGPDLGVEMDRVDTHPNLCAGGNEDPMDECVLQAATVDDCARWEASVALFHGVVEVLAVGQRRRGEVPVPGGGHSLGELGVDLVEDACVARHTVRTLGDADGGALCGGDDKVDKCSRHLIFRVTASFHEHSQDVARPLCARAGAHGHGAFDDLLRKRQHFE
mmetsp:Transcript_5855/g.14335  ORF Transcript_5855/g.14335 Transcript_5855/m.14335 type:complete len:298 (+) Transcript_5855:104-997(+)